MRGRGVPSPGAGLARSARPAALLPLVANPVWSVPEQGVGGSTHPASVHGAGQCGRTQESAGRRAV